MQHCAALDGKGCKRLLYHLVVGRAMFLTEWAMVMNMNVPTYQCRFGKSGPVISLHKTVTKQVVQIFKLL